MANKEATLLLKIKEVGSEALSKVTGLLSGIADAAKYVGAGLVSFGALAVAAFREQEEATNQLSQAMVNQGIYSNELADKYQKQASALQALTTFGDEQIIGAQAILQAYVGQREVTKELTMATLNLAAAKKMDLSSAAEAVAKTIGTSTNALARQGIEIKDNLTSSERYAAVIEQLNSKFAGQAEAAASGLGSLVQMKNALSDFMELVGERLAPYISMFARQMIVFTNSLMENKNAMAGLDAVVLFLAKGFAYLKGGVVTLTEVISTGLAASIESISLLTQGEFSKAKEMAALGMSEMGQIIKDNGASLNEELAAIDEQRAIADETKRAADLVKLQQSEALKTKVKTDEMAKQQAAKDKADADAAKKQAKIDADTLANRKSTLDTIATMQTANNKTLAAIGKAAAITQIAIDTPMAISKALAAFPPPFNFAAAGLVGAAMAMQAARVAGIALADGGIVKATPGGVPAIIGEGGRDEAVIPLENGTIPGGMGGGVTININGNVVGDEQSLYALAKMLDPQFLKLRQNNESVAFDTGVF